jgi:hypothetical protein
MPPSSQNPILLLTLAQIDAWIYNATVKHLQLRLQATEPLPPARVEAFLEMAELCEDAIEETRVISAQLRETSQTLRGQSAEIAGAFLKMAELCKNTIEETRVISAQSAEIITEYTRLLARGTPSDLQ